MILTRDNDFEHYVKCGKCDWEGWAAEMRHGYQGYGNGEDVEAMDFCPECDTSEEFATAFITCKGLCIECQERFECFTKFRYIPIKGRRRNNG